MTTTTPYVNPYVTLVVKYTDLDFLAKSLSQVNNTYVSLKNDIQYTINYLNELTSTKEGANLVRIELKMESDVAFLLDLIKNKTIFKYLTSAEIRGYELWKLEELILELPLMHKQQILSEKISSFCK